MEATKDVSLTKWYFFRNLFFIGAAALFLTMPYYLFLMFLPSLYPEDSLGRWTNGISSAIQTPACLFFAALIMKKMGYKGPLLISSGCMAIFVSANFLPSFATLMSGGILLGLGAGIMLTIFNTMTCELANGYAVLTGSTATSTTSFFFGISYSIKESASIWINICAALLIEPGSVAAIANRNINATCGKHFCNEMSRDTFLFSNHSSKIQTSKSFLPSDDTLYALCAAAFISILIAIIATLLINFKGEEPAKDIDIKSSFLSTLRLMRTPDVLLLSPFTISTGIVFSSYSADFLTAFVTCTVGLHYVATVSIVFGACTTVTSIFAGFIGKHVKPFYIMMLAVPCTLAAPFLMFFWNSTPDSLVPFHIMGGFWGLLWAVWQIQLSAVYGTTFSDDLESGFSCLRLLQCLGLTLGFALSSLTCLQQRLIISSSFLLCGVMGYLIFEVRVRNRKSYTHLEDD